MSVRSKSEVLTGIVRSMRSAGGKTLYACFHHLSISDNGIWTKIMTEAEAEREWEKEHGKD